MGVELAVDPTSGGYAAAGVLFTALGVLSLTRWQRGLGGLWLPPALFASAGWAAFLASGRDSAVPGTVFEFSAEVVRAGLWLLVLSRIVPKASDAWTRYLRWGAIGAPLVVLAIGAAASVMADLGMSAAPARLPTAQGVLALSLFGVVLIEQAIRNAPASDRWAIKYVLFGIGACLTFDLVLYASSSAFGVIEPGLWQARGGVNALAALVLALGLRRLSAHRPAAQSSQGVIFYTGTLIAVGLYLVVIAFFAIYVRVVGGTWGASLQALFVACALLALMAALFSSQARARAIVVLAKTFSPYRYDYRVEWLRLTEALSGSEELQPLAERALRAVIQIVHSPAGGLWMRDEAGAFAPVAGEIATAPEHLAQVDDRWVVFLGAREWILDLSVALPHELRSVELPPWLVNNPRVWLVVPLLRAQSLEGFIVAARPLVPSAALTWEDLDLLRAAGRQVAAFLAFERVAQRLAQAHQFEAYNRFAAFMMHDLKNVAAQLGLVVQNAQTHRRKPEFVDDAIATVDNATHRMLRMLAQFGRGAESNLARRVSVVSVCRQVVARRASSEPCPELVAPDTAIEVTLDPDRLANVIEHVVRNAQEATPPSGRVTIEVGERNGSVVVAVSDTGCGMDPEFIRDRLFRPFESTKGSQGMGIGAYQTREFVRSAGGRVDVSSTVGKGTTVSIELPLAPAIALAVNSGGTVG